MVLAAYATEKKDVKISKEKKVISFAKKVESLVDNYYASLVFDSPLGQLASTTHDDHCDDEDDEMAITCFEFACRAAGTFGCDDRREVLRVHRYCRGNYNGLCLQAVCSKLGTFGCDDHRELARLAPACVGNFDASCINATCGRLGTFGCDDEREVIAVARSCGGS